MPAYMSQNRFSISKTDPRTTNKRFSLFQKLPFIFRDKYPKKMVNKQKRIDSRDMVWDWLINAGNKCMKNSLLSLILFPLFEAIVHDMRT